MYHDNAMYCDNALFCNTGETNTKRHTHHTPPTPTHTHTHTHTLLTIALAKDVLGGLAQVCVGGRDSHDAINRKQNVI